MAGSIRKRSNTWQAKWDVWSPCGERKTKYKTLAAKGKKEAERELAALIAGGDRPTAPANYTVNNLIDEWLDTDGRNRAGRTVERWTELADHHIRPHIGDRRLRDLTAKDIRMLLNDLTDNGRRDDRGGLAPRTVRHVYRLLYQILEFAVKDDPPKLATNPADNVKAPHVPKTTVKAFTEDELVTLLQGAKELMPEHFVAFFIAAHTGVRRGELLALRWSDIDFDAKTMTVSRAVEQLKRCNINIKPTKTERVRTIALSQAALDNLKTHRRDQLELRMRLGAGGGDGYIFPNPKTMDVLIPDRLTSQFGRLVAKLEGIPPYSLQALRRTAISLALSNKFSANAVANRAGHASAFMTLDVYGKAYDEDQIEIAKDMDKWAVKL
jgi:integrase